MDEIIVVPSGNKKTNKNFKFELMMKVKKFMFVLMGTILVFSSCSDSELGSGENGNGAGQSATNSPLVNVYADEDCSEASLLAGDILLKESATRTLTLNAPIHADKVYMKYNTVSGGEAKKVFALTPVTRSGGADFSYETSRVASVTMALPEDAVKPTSETDAGYLFYHNTGVAMFEDGWPTKPKSWYDEDFNDVVFEYDLKVTECQDAEQMELQGSKEELLITLDVRAMGGQNPTVLGVVLEGLDSKYIDRITASLVLKGGQGVMTNLNKKELSTDDKVVVEARDWSWENQIAKRYSKLTVDKTPTEGTIITLDGLSTLKDDNKNFFQVTPGFIKEGLEMVRAEVRLIGKEGLTGAERTAQLEAFRELILNTNRQNFFIKTVHGIEIHMKGYAPTSAYQEKYKELVAKDSELDADIPYTNVDGYTWGVKVPVGARHAFEDISFAEAYTGFTEWIDSNGASNKEWYLNPDAEKTVRYW